MFVPDHDAQGALSHLTERRFVPLWRFSSSSRLPVWKVTAVVYGNIVRSTTQQWPQRSCDTCCCRKMFFAFESLLDRELFVGSQAEDLIFGEICLWLYFNSASTWAEWHFCAISGIHSANLGSRSSGLHLLRLPLNGSLWLFLRKSASNTKHTFRLITNNTGGSVKAKLLFDVMTRPHGLCRPISLVLMSCGGMAPSPWLVSHSLVPLTTS